MLIRFIGLMAIFAIFGCGMMAKDDESKKLSVPQKISMEMPKELKSDSKKSSTRNLKKIEEDDNNSSLGYTELKEDVAQSEDMIADLELNLLFVNQVIEDIDTICKTVEIGEICTIDEDVLSFEIDENLSKKVADLGYLLGDTIIFGKTEFIRYSKKDTYQYEIKMDNNFVDVLSSTETIKWSKDEHQIYSWFEQETINDRQQIEIDYNISSTGEKIMQMEDNYFKKSTKESDNFALTIIKKTDDPRHYEISSKSNAVEYIDTKEEKSYFSSTGELSSHGGYLLFYGEFKGDKFTEREIFDNRGEQVETLFCMNNIDCDIEN